MWAQYAYTINQICVTPAFEKHSQFAHRHNYQQINSQPGHPHGHRYRSQPVGTKLPNPWIKQVAIQHAMEIHEKARTYPTPLDWKINCDSSVGIGSPGFLTHSLGSHLLRRIQEVLCLPKNAWGTAQACNQNLMASKRPPKSVELSHHSTA